MTLCYLALGSNLGSPSRQLRLAIQRLRKLPHTQVIKVATFYSNPAWGRKTQPLFSNSVVAINTTLPPATLLNKCLAIEHKQGRYRKLKWGARTLDIDILLYGSQRIQTQTLTIPHPQLLLRDFVLIPLLEIAPDVCMPNGEKIGLS